jgi:hypothetical protein
MFLQVIKNRHEVYKMGVDHFVEFHFSKTIKLIKLGSGVSICLDRVLIETLNLDTGREPVSTVEIFSTV